MPLNQIFWVSLTQNFIAQLFPCLGGTILNAYVPEKMESLAMMSPAHGCNLSVIGHCTIAHGRYKNGLLIGTPPNPPEKLYDLIIEAFDKAIVDILAREDLE